MNTNNRKLPTSNPPPKQMSILNFLSRATNGQAAAQAQNQQSSNGRVLPPAPKQSTIPSGGIIPPLLNRYAPVPTPLASVSTPRATPPPAALATSPIDDATSLPPPVALTPTASLVPITEPHIPTLRTLNQITLPVQYGDKFYSTIQSRSPSSSGLYSRIILTHPSPSSSNPNPDPIFAGAVICRAEISPFQAQSTPNPDLALYIQSLALFSPYRGQGLMGLAISEILRTAATNPPQPQVSNPNHQTPTDPKTWGNSSKITCVYAHVWTENHDGLRWYAAQGFEKVGYKPLEAYYHRLRPGTAWILRRPVRIADFNLLSPTPTPVESPARAPVEKGLNGARDGNNNDDEDEIDTSVPEPRAGVTSNLQNTTTIPSIPSPKSPSPSPVAAARLLTGSAGLAVAPPRPGPPVNRGRLGPTTPTAASGPPGRQSFQNTRPDIEWNDLPADMVMTGGAGNGDTNGIGVKGNGNGNVNGGGVNSGPGSTTSSRSSSSVAGARRKRARDYPAAAFG